MKRTWVIAGGSQGLGRETAKQAYASGYPVAVIGRDVLALQSLERELLAQNRKEKVSIHTADLGDAAATSKAFEQITSQHGTLGALVNCAGTWINRVQAKDLDAALIGRSLELNFFAAFHPTQAALAVRRANEPLCIVFIGATASVRGGAQTAPFCLAKAAVRSLAQSLARELGPQGVHVSHLIVDGLIDNERTRKLNPQTPSDHYLAPQSIARSIQAVVEQDPSCWAFEWDLRPFCEKW